MFYVGPKVCQKILVGIKAYVSSSKISSGKLSLVLYVSHLLELIFLLKDITSFCLHQYSRSVESMKKTQTHY